DRAWRRSEASSRSPRAARNLFVTLVASGGSARLALRDPLVDPTLEQVQRQGAAAEHGVVEAADVEAVAKFGFGLPAQFLDADHADLVGGGLARPGDVALDLRADRRLGRRGNGADVSHRLPL